MTEVGQKERATQRRVVALFRDALGYDYLGDWHERPGNRNVERDLLRAFLVDRQGVDPALAARAVEQFARAADNASQSPYDRNREVYGLLRYGVKVKPDAGERTAPSGAPATSTPGACG